MHQPNLRRGVPGLPDHWQQFFACVVLHLFLPLSIPLLAEIFVSRHVNAETLTIGSAVYVMVIGTSSRNVLQLVISIALGFVFSLLFAALKSGSIKPDAIQPWMWIVIGLFVAAHAFERFNRHVMERAPYFEFWHGHKE